MSRRAVILNTVDDLVTDFINYDRKEDVDLPRGGIEEAIELKDITVEEIVKRFEKKLKTALK